MKPILTTLAIFAIAYLCFGWWVTQKIRKAQDAGQCDCELCERWKWIRPIPPPHTWPHRISCILNNPIDYVAYYLNNRD